MTCSTREVSEKMKPVKIRLFIARFVPDPILCFFHGPIGIVLERAGEVAWLRMPIDKQSGRNEAQRVFF